MVLWKNVWYNLVSRQWYLLKYYWRGLYKTTYYPLSGWNRFYRPFIHPWTKAQEDKLYEVLRKAVRNTVLQSPSLRKIGGVWLRGEE